MIYILYNFNVPEVESIILVSIFYLLHIFFLFFFLFLCLLLNITNNLLLKITNISFILCPVS